MGGDSEHRFTDTPITWFDEYRFCYETQMVGLEFSVNGTNP